ncbi:MAG: sigma 54-interacting transcriptional regulator [Negativicutes bacterium]|nr:sigma 54-interacting transcriptional regulator [Negativicutes bacterium]
MNEERPAALEEKFVENVFRIFDHMPIGINFVDENGKVIRLNKAMLDYFKFTHDVEGRHIYEIEPTSRLPIVLQTRKAEIGQRHRFADGREAIVHRIPVIDNGKLIGALGIILFGDVQDVYLLAERNRLLLNKLAHYEKEKSPYQAKYGLHDILGDSPDTRACKEQVRRIARSNSNVLIIGESGVGKELFAHAIHLESPRRDAPFVRLNCAAIPETLLESELFGYVEGAFTGAKKGGQAGKFELAEGGTLFLDEIGDMPYAMQAKLLRVLQEREFERVGGKEIVRVNVRVISATNVELESLVQTGGFRRDLFYRLNVLSLKIGPLRERREDIPNLVYHFLGQIYQENGCYATISQECLAALARYSWPGNIRELRNVVEKIALEAEGRVSRLEDMPAYIRRNLGNSSVPLDKSKGLRALLAQVEADSIRQALEQCGGCKTQAAAWLQIPKMRLYRKLKQFKLEN